MSETLDKKIRRIYLARLEETIRWSRAPHTEIHDAIHDIRKNFKFLRALLRLVKSVMDPELFESENYLFRDLGRVVADIRDLHVMTILMETLSAECGPGSAVSGNQVLENMRAIETQILSKMLDEEEGFDAIEKGVLTATGRLHEIWPEIPDAIEVLLPGVGGVYAKGRAGYMAASGSSTVMHFHEWRKQVKYLLHMFEILSDITQAGDPADEVKLRGLSEYLGEEHDLAVFQDFINTNPICNLFRGVEKMNERLDERRTVLQERSLALGKQIYSRSSAEFLDRFKSTYYHAHQNRKGHVY